MDGGGEADPTVMWAIYQAVSTRVAKQLWDSGECKQEPADAAAAPMAPGSPGATLPHAVKVMTIGF